MLLKFSCRMRRNQFRYICVFLMLLLFGCSKEKLEETDIITDIDEDEFVESEFVLRPTTKGLQNFDLSLLIQGDTNRLVFAKHDNVEYEVGDVIIIDQCQSFPYGMMSKIISRQSDSDRIIYETEIASLNEAFSKYEFTINQSIESDKQRSVVPKIKLTKNLTFEGNGSEAYPTEIELDWSYDNIVHADFDENNDNALTNLEIGLRNFVLTLDLEILIQVNKSSLELKAAQIGSIPLPTITIPTSPTTPPIFLLGDITAETFAKITGSGTTTVGFDLTTTPINAFVRLDPEARNWTFENTSLSDFAIILDPSFKSNAQVAAEAGIKFKIVYKPYGISGVLDMTPAQLTVSGKAEIQPNYMVSPFQIDIQPSGTMKVSSSVDVGLFGLESLIPTGAALKFGYDWPEPFNYTHEYPRYSIPIPCTIVYDSVFVNCRCDESNDETILSFFIDAFGGSADGYRVYINDIEVPTLNPLYYDDLPTTYNIRPDNIGYENVIRFEDKNDFTCSIVKSFRDPCNLFRDCENQITDARDGQSYCIALMPDGKWWMAEDLKYAQGGGVCYNNSQAYCEIYGRLYTFSEVLGGDTPNQSTSSNRNVKGICPDGWHIPTLAEWESLITALEAGPISGSAFRARKKMKAFGWLNWTESGEDPSGFDALPSGQTYPWKSDQFKFGGNGREVHYWSSTTNNEDLNTIQAKGIFTTVIEGNELLNPRLLTIRDVGNSCRCVKD